MKRSKNTPMLNIQAIPFQGGSLILKPTLTLNKVSSTDFFPKIMVSDLWLCWSQIWSEIKPSVLISVKQEDVLFEKVIKVILDFFRWPDNASLTLHWFVAMNNLLSSQLKSHTRATLNPSTLCMSWKLTQWEKQRVKRTWGPFSSKCKADGNNSFTVSSLPLTHLCRYCSSPNTKTKGERRDQDRKNSTLNR